MCCPVIKLPHDDARKRHCAPPFRPAPRQPERVMRFTPFSVPPVSQADPAGQPASPSRSRVLWLSCVAHALHDGYTDMIYVLLPVWQADFGLDYGALALLRGVYAGTMATLQLP